MGAIIGALESGQIDAWSIVPHIAKPLAASGAVQIIGDLSDYLQDDQVPLILSALWVIVSVDMGMVEKRLLALRV